MGTSMHIICINSSQVYSSGGASSACLPMAMASKSAIKI